ncbi:MAG TPA: hypothetical protein VH165_00835 [Kofleriaceae bacterium]|jgi:hypothetical protein|nr:hypothetical protein [Kofleriaceae bacterium]
MEEVGIDTAVRHAIGGDADAVTWIIAAAATTDDASVVAMAAVLEGRPDRLARAQALATTSRDRQLLAIAGAHLDGQRELVDALARDHLVDHPDSLIVAWIAAGTPVN